MKYIFLLLLLVCLIFQYCGHVEYMDEMDEVSTKATIITGSLLFNDDDSLIICTASLKFGMGQVVSRCGFCYGMGNIIPLLARNGCDTVISSYNLLPGIDINADGIEDFPGATSGNISYSISSGGFSSSIKCTKDTLFSVRPFIILNQVSIIYGSVDTVSAKLK